MDELEDLVTEEEMNSVWFHLVVGWFHCYRYWIRSYILLLVGLLLLIGSHDAALAHPAQYNGLSNVIDRRPLWFWSLFILMFMKHNWSQFYFNAPYKVRMLAAVGVFSLLLGAWVLR